MICLVLYLNDDSWQIYCICYMSLHLNPFFPGITSQETEKAFDQPQWIYLPEILQQYKQFVLWHGLLTKITFSLRKTIDAFCGLSKCLKNTSSLLNFKLSGNASSLRTSTIAVFVVGMGKWFTEYPKYVIGKKHTEPTEHFWHSFIRVQLNCQWRLQNCSLEYVFLCCIFLIADLRVLFNLWA